METAGWHRDPFGRFDLRYHDGKSWTEHVSLGGRQAIDPQGSSLSTLTATSTSKFLAPPSVVAPTPAPGVRQVGNGMAVAALVLGLIGLLAGIVPVFFFLAIPCGILAFIFGFVGRRRAVAHQASGKGMAISGLVLGALAFGLGVLGWVIVNRAVDEIGSKIGATFDSVVTLPSSDLATLPSSGSSPANLVIESGFTPNAERGVVSAGALITNTGGKTACGVEVQFSLLDSAGAPVDTDTSTISIIPGGRTVSLSPGQLGYRVADPAQLRVSVLEIDSQIESDRLDDCSGFYIQKGIGIEVLNPVLQRSFGVDIEGQLSNPSDTKVDLTHVDCVLKLGGRIVGGDSSLSLDPIAPKGVVAFRIGLLSYEGEVDEILCSAMA